MGQKTGRPRGRPPGAKNKRTAEREQQMARAAQAVEMALDDAFDGDAHALLMAVYKDKGLELPLRIDAAKAAIRYEKPALAATTLDADVKSSVELIEWTVIDPAAPSS